MHLLTLSSAVKGGSVRAIPPQIFCQLDGGTETPSKLRDCLMPIIKDLARMRRIIVVWAVIGDCLFVNRFVYGMVRFGASGRYGSGEKWP